MYSVTSIVGLLIVAVANGEALRCYVGVPGDALVEIDCDGSCATVESEMNGQKSTSVACSGVRKLDTCDVEPDFTSCYCNTDLCNTGGSGGGGGGDKPKPSGSSALKVTWAVTCLVAIATAVGRVVF